MSEEVDKTNEDLFPLIDARRLEYVNHVRESLVKEIVTDKIKIPEERGNKELLVSLLDGMERTVFNKAKIKTDKKAADNASEASALIANVLKSMPSLSSLQSNHQVGAKIPELPNTLEKPALIEGETAVGSQSQNIDEFMAKFPNPVNNT